MRRTTALIAGGGPAGAAAAILLARGGASPLLIERSSGPQDIVCGGFLGWDALASLAAIGLDPAALGMHPIHRLRVIARGRQIETALPRFAAGLSRRRLDAELLRLAEQAGARIERGSAIRRIEEGLIHLADGAVLSADSLFLATGKHDLRGLGRPREAAGDDPAVGLRQRLVPSPALARALDGTIELHLFDRGYAGLLRQEDGSINLCLSVAASRLAAAGGPEELALAVAREAPLFGDRLGGVVDADRWVAVSGIPYGWRAAATSPGLFRLGDQAAVIASLAGDGVAIALASGRAAATAWLAGGPAAAGNYQRNFHRRAARPLAVAGALKMLAERPGLSGPLLGSIGRLPGLPPLLARLTRIGA